MSDSTADSVQVGSIAELSDRFMEQWAKLAPDEATFSGVTGHESEITDHSPQRRADRLAALRSTIAEVKSLPTGAHADRVAIEFHLERLSTRVELIETDEDLRALRILGSPLQEIRWVFDILGKESAEEWETIADRLENVPAAVDGLRALLEEGIRADVVSSRRQTTECILQCEAWAGRGDERDFFSSMVADADADVAEAMEHRLGRAALAAADSYSQLGVYLGEKYLPTASERDAVGEDRYRVLARSHLGMEIDPHDMYDWAWDEMSRIEQDMAATAEQILPGEGIDAVIDHLETDAAECIEGEQALRQWLQDLMDATIEALDGTHFDIADPVKRVEAMIAPPGGAAAMYYTGPSEDFSRPGRTWYPTLGRTRFPRWGEVSICYHEGVPGHHLQVGQVTYLGDQLTALQRREFVPGHGEGWALYAERLMDEIGFLEDPAYRLGYLRAQVMRAMRVIVDIGMHLELEIPADSDFAPGSKWDPVLGQQFANERSRFPAEFMASEVSRYLGLPGQAISYKVGERVWLDGRAEVKRRLGPEFDLKSFHRQALDLGHLGLDQLRAEFARIT
ncbi:MAG: DUF885 domain-containing protein [Acidobacteria bacterium]|nr:DUF885 domain-containing protein [Acidobacteriota bacterium]